MAYPTNDSRSDDGPPPGPGVLEAGRSRLQSVLPDHAGPWFLVDVAAQRLHRIVDGAAGPSWPVSTATIGLDGREGSGGTPPGVHRIDRRIGEGEPSGAIFVSRRPTGQVWREGVPEGEDLILTRILTLDGCEPGVNAGPGCDSRERYIYLHGTNHEEALGRPLSHGCVRLANPDIRTVFDLAAEGDPVVII